MRRIQKRMGGQRVLKGVSDPAAVRAIVLDALAADQSSQRDAARVQRNNLSALERRAVRTVTNRGAAVRSRQRQRVQLCELQAELAAKDSQLEALQKAFGAVQNVLGSLQLPVLTEHPAADGDAADASGFQEPVVCKPFSFPDADDNADDEGGHDMRQIDANASLHHSEHEQVRPHPHFHQQPSPPPQSHHHSPSQPGQLDFQVDPQMAMSVSLCSLPAPGAPEESSSSPALAVPPPSMVSPVTPAQRPSHEEFDGMGDPQFVLGTNGFKPDDQPLYSAANEPCDVSAEVGSGDCNMFTCNDVFSALAKDAACSVDVHGGQTPPVPDGDIDCIDMFVNDEHF